MKTQRLTIPDKKEKPMGTVIMYPNCRVPDEPPRELLGLEFDCEWRIGDRIFHHTKYGAGTVVAVSRQKLTVDFDRAGRKIVWAIFVSLLNGDDGGDAA
jgi:hypothetical protein